jgi:hypothetical protein
VLQLFIHFKKAYDSVKSEALFNILLEFDVPKELIRLIKMCLNETYTKVHTGKLLSDEFPFGIAFQFCFGICHQECPRD